MIELHCGHGAQRVGYKSMARKYGISQPSLRRLHARFLEDGFSNTPGWEMEVMDSGLLSDDTDSSIASDGD